MKELFISFIHARGKSDRNNWSSTLSIPYFVPFGFLTFHPAWIKCWVGTFPESLKKWWDEERGGLYLLPT